MAHTFNHLNQPIGLPVTGWTPPPHPPREPMAGRFCRLEPLEVDCHARDLYAAYSEDVTGALWTYLPYGPFSSLEQYIAWIEETCTGLDPLFFAILDAPSGAAVGVAALQRIVPSTGVMEVGHLSYSPRLQRTPAATEAMYLMMQRAFTLGYRRYEWKCDALNAPSGAAALRLGFSYEGIFRQAFVYKGRNRDTKWYACIDEEWPQLEAAFEQWLQPDNFDSTGRQRLRLSDLTGPILKTRG